MIEVILIIVLAAIFIILLKRLPEVKLDSDLQQQSGAAVNVPAEPVIMTTKPVFGEKIGKLWEQAEEEFERKNFSRAEKLYLRIAATDPKNPKLYGRLGVIYLEQKNFLDAKEAFSEAVKREPQNALWYNNLGLALYNLKRFSESIEAYRKSVAIDNTKAIRFFNLGLVYEALGESKKALRVYERAAVIEPDNLEFQNLVLRIKGEMKKK